MLLHSRHGPGQVGSGTHSLLEARHTNTMAPEQRACFSQSILFPVCVGRRATSRLPDAKPGTIMLVGVELCWLTELAPVLDAPAMLIRWR